jgi:hypothetical protein
MTLFLRPKMLLIVITLASPAIAQPKFPACDIAAGFRTTCIDPDGTVYIVPQRPDDDLVREALMLAYKMNGSMVSYGSMIDLTAPVFGTPKYVPVKPPGKQK